MNCSTNSNDINNASAQASRLLSALDQSLIKDIVSGNAHLLCIDFGHGETTVAQMRIKNNVNNRFEVEVVPLTLDEEGLVRKAPTYIFVPDDLENGKIAIGDAARSRAKSGVKGDFYCYFKRMPDRADELAVPMTGESPVGEQVSYGYLMKSFLQTYLDTVSKGQVGKTNNLSSNKKVVLMIGRPSGDKWEKQEKEYKALFDGLTVMGNKPVATYVVSESLAALAQSVNDSESIEYEFDETVICIDMGSSTADITCVCKGNRVYEYGISLGAHEIENNMLALGLESWNDNEDTDWDASDLEATALPDLREAKENYFGDDTKESQPRQRVYINIPSNEDDIRIVVKEELITKAIERTAITFKDKNAPTGKMRYDSWYQACKAFYEKARDDIFALIDEKKIPPIKLVILTGGASRVTCVKELTNEVFGTVKQGYHHSKFRIYQSCEPSYTVSKGLAWITYNAAKTEQILAEVKGGLRTLIGDNTYVDVYSSLANYIAPIIHSICYDQMYCWSKRTWPESVNEMLRDTATPTINTRLNSEECKKKYRDIVIDWYKNGGNGNGGVDLRAITSSLKNQFSDLFGVSLDGMEIPLPENVVEEIAEKVSQLNIRLESTELVRRGIAILPILSGFYDLNNQNLAQNSRQNYAMRWNNRSDMIISSISGQVFEYLNEETDFLALILDSVANAITKAIDEKINDISMYCFKKIK